MEELVYINVPNFYKCDWITHVGSYNFMFIQLLTSNIINEFSWEKGFKLSIKILNIYIFYGWFSKIRHKYVMFFKLYNWQLKMHFKAYSTYLIPQLSHWHIYQDKL